MSGGLALRRFGLVILLSTAVAVMHALSTTGAGHHGGGIGASATALAGGAAHGHHGERHDPPSDQPAPPEPSNHLMSMAACAFAVLLGTRRLRLSGDPRDRVRPPAGAPALPLLAGPEPPVPRSAF